MSEQVDEGPSWETLVFAAFNSDLVRVAALVIAYARADQLLRGKLGAKAYDEIGKLKSFIARTRLVRETESVDSVLQEIEVALRLRNHATHSARVNGRLRFPKRPDQMACQGAIRTFAELAYSLGDLSANVSVIPLTAWPRSSGGVFIPSSAFDELSQAASSGHPLSRVGAAMVAGAVAEGALVMASPDAGDLSMMLLDKLRDAIARDLIPASMGPWISDAIHIRNKCAHEGHLISEEEAIRCVACFRKVADILMGVVATTPSAVAEEVKQDGHSPPFPDPAPPKKSDRDSRPPNVTLAIWWAFFCNSMNTISGVFGDVARVMGRALNFVASIEYRRRGEAAGDFIVKTTMGLILLCSLSCIALGIVEFINRKSQPLPRPAVELRSNQHRRPHSGRSRHPERRQNRDGRRSHH